MRFKIYFGEKGRGKTTKLYILSERRKTTAYFCGKQNDGDCTYSCLMGHKDLKSVDFKEIFAALVDLLNYSEALIIDSAQLIDNKEFEYLINAASHSNICDVSIIFDISKEQFCYCSNYLQLAHFPIALSAEIIEFTISDNEFKNRIAKNYPIIDSTEYDTILKITNRNFLNVANLMWHKKIINEYSSHVSQEVYFSYINSVISITFANLPSDLLCTLQKSSVIGMEFSKTILESPDGFNIFEVSKYLRELEKMHIFIASCMNDDDNYSFVTHEVYEAIFDGIDPITKKTWLEVLITYFQRQLKNHSSGLQKIRILGKLKLIYTLLNNQKGIFIASICLLKEYALINDFEHCISLANELYNNLDSTEYNGLKQFFFAYLLKNYKQVGEYKSLLACIQNSENNLFYMRSSLYFDYYKALSYYNIGNVDDAKKITDNIIKIFKTTEKNYFAQQPIYSLTFSLAATIYHHLHLQGDGIQYFRLALNHAKNKIIDQDIYYDILKKCDMYCDYAQFKKALSECIDYYKRTNNQSRLGEAYFNLGTEYMMQNGDNDSKAAYNYLIEAENIFAKIPNERFAYSKNNLALYYFLVQNNIELSFNKMEEALVLGLSHFTYMTIYLNLCSLLIYTGNHYSDKFRRYYEAFCEHVDALNKRKYPTKYETIYRNLLEISLEEKEGHRESIIEKCKILCQNKDIDIFFQNILLQILDRNSEKKINLMIQENKFYYKRINETKIFLAEFRFWE